MIISSERKNIQCPDCKGSGEKILQSGFPFLPDTVTMCTKCVGKGKIESNDYDYDKNAINIDNVVTIGEIDWKIDAWSGITEYQWAKVWFYINGHIKIMEEGKERHTNGDRESDKSSYEKALEDKEKLYLKIKKIRDDIIQKLARKRK